MNKPDLVYLDVFLHSRTSKGLQLSRTGDLRHAGWVAESLCTLAMRGEVQALATMPRWAALQAGLIQTRAGEEQPGLFEGR